MDVGGVESVSRSVAVDPPPPGTPRLVLLVVIDQFGTAEFEHLAPQFTAGYRRLIDGGVVFPRAVHDHAVTETGPGHASISTGQYPRDNGVVSNWLVEPGNPELIWVGDDDEFDKSPHRLMVPALADWLQQRYPPAKVFTASAKARAAIMLGGQHPDTAFWWEEEIGSFETSPYYDSPDWFARFNQERSAERFFGEVWEPLPLPEEVLADLEVETLDLGPTRPSFPHVFGGPRPAPVESFYDDMWESPWLDEHLTELVHAILDEEQLGADEVPDLLAMSFSVSDIIGHRFGPSSREYVDILLRQDRLVGDLLDHIDRQVGLEHTLVVVTSDHGVVPVPEIRQRHGLAGERIGWPTVACIQQAGRNLASEHGVEKWLISGTFLAPGLVEATGLSRAELERQTAERLEACPGVEKVWTSTELTSPEAREEPASHDDELWLFANSYYPGRSADLLIRFSEYLMTSRANLTTHGTSYAYDRDVPVIFRLPNAVPARSDSRFATVDIAPTIAALLDVPAPPDVDGKNRSRDLGMQSGIDP